MASGKPFKPSITATRISFSPRWLSSFMTPSQNLAPSLCWIQIPSTSLVPSLWMPNARYTALFLTVPSSRILTLKASKNTTGYIGSKGRFCHSMTSSRIESVTVLIRSVDTSTLYCSSKKRLISRTVIPWAYIAMILVSNPPKRFWPLRMSCGSNSPLRSRATSISSFPSSLISVFLLLPLRWFSRRPEHSLVEPLMQLFQDPSGTGQIFRSLVILHQLFNDRPINPRLLAFLALLFSLLLLGHFHLLSQVVTHTQILRHPRGAELSDMETFVDEMTEYRAYTIAELVEHARHHQLFEWIVGNYQDPDLDPKQRSMFGYLLKRFTGRVFRVTNQISLIVKPMKFEKLSQTARKTYGLRDP